MGEGEGRREAKAESSDVMENEFLKAKPCSCFSPPRALSGSPNVCKSRTQLASVRCPVPSRHVSPLAPGPRDLLGHRTGCAGTWRGGRRVFSASLGLQLLRGRAVRMEPFRMQKRFVNLSWHFQNHGPVAKMAVGDNWLSPPTQG